jgi:hypothetical protein
MSECSGGGVARGGGRGVPYRGAFLDLGTALVEDGQAHAFNFNVVGGTNVDGISHLAGVIREVDLADHGRIEEIRHRHGKPSDEALAGGRVVGFNLTLAMIQLPVLGE